MRNSRCPICHGPSAQKAIPVAKHEEDKGVLDWLREFSGRRLRHCPHCGIIFRVPFMAALWRMINGGSRGLTAEELRSASRRARVPFDLEDEYEIHPLLPERKAEAQPAGPVQAENPETAETEEKSGLAVQLRCSCFNLNFCMNFNRRQTEEQGEESRKDARIPMSVLPFMRRRALIRKRENDVVASHLRARVGLLSRKKEVS